MGRYITPDSVPPTSYCRRLFIPDSPQWVGTISGALYPLMFPSAWEQVAGITAEEAASAVQAMLFDFWAEDGTCEAMDVRQSPVDACTLQKSTDGGETWVDFADLSLCPPNLLTTIQEGRIRRNLNTGHYEWSPDGVTFYKFPDGPWGEDVGITAPSPPPRSGTETENRCIAAANAALVMNQLYVETWLALDRLVTGTILDIVRGLTEAAQAILPVNIPLDESVALAQESYQNSSRFTDGGFTTLVRDELREILFCLATDTAGVVTFDFDAARAALHDKGDVAPWRGIYANLGFLGEAGLNIAGGVKAETSAECTGSQCTFCWFHSFGVDQGGFANVPGTTEGQWVADQGWVGTFVNTSSRAAIFIDRSFADTDVTTITLQYDKPAGGGANNVANVIWFKDGVEVARNTSNPIGFDIVREVPVNAIIDRILLSFNTGTTGDVLAIEEITIEGQGENPFGSDNC